MNLRVVEKTIDCILGQRRVLIRLDCVVEIPPGEDESKHKIEDGLKRNTSDFFRTETPKEAV